MKKIYLFGLLILSLILISGEGCVIQNNPDEDINNTIKPEPINLSIICQDRGGEWKSFTNTCIDSCGEKPRICGQAITEGCDCGSQKCWNGIQCIIDEFEPYATQEEACRQTAGKLTSELPTLLTDLNFYKNEICKWTIRGEEITICDLNEDELRIQWGDKADSGFEGDLIIYPINEKTDFSEVYEKLLNGEILTLDNGKKIDISFFEKREGIFIEDVGKFTEGTKDANTILGTFKFFCDGHSIANTCFMYWDDEIEDKYFEQFGDLVNPPFCQCPKETTFSGLRGCILNQDLPITYSLFSIFGSK